MPSGQNDKAPSYAAGPSGLKRKVSTQKLCFASGVYGLIFVLGRIALSPSRGLLKTFLHQIIATSEELSVKTVASSFLGNLNSPLSSIGFVKGGLVEDSQEDSHKIQGPLNIVILYPDDWRHDDLQDANPNIHTPTFTQLAKEGIRFTYNAVTTSICWISRASLFTGRYVSGHASTYLFRPIFAADPNNWQKTWPYLLQKVGYFVGHVGKWQYRDSQSYRAQIFNWSSYFEAWIVRKNRRGESTEYIADVAQREAFRFLRERPKNLPFAMTVAFYPPKGIWMLSDCKRNFTSLYDDFYPQEPYDVNEAYTKLPPFLQHNRTEARQRYLKRYVETSNHVNATKAQYATLTHLDYVSGQIIQELKRQGVYNNTLIIVTADNGEFHGRHALHDKWYPYQEAIRVPLIIKDPRMPKNKRGTTDDHFTLNIDLAETILGAAGLKVPSEMDGRDIADLYLDNPQSTKPWREEFYYEFPDINPAIPPSSALVRKDWKYIDWWKHKSEEMFNVEKDPYELNNVVKRPEYATLKTEMRRRMIELRHKIFWPNVPFTSCDPLWPVGTNYSTKPKCSPDLPHICCGNASAAI